MVPRSARSPLKTWNLALLAMVAMGCSIAFGCAPSQPPSETASLPAAASLTPVPGGSNAASPPTTGELPTQTDAEWGRIWDALPPSFPVPPGSVPAETREGPVSASLAVGASVEQASDFVVAGLTSGGSRIDRPADPSEDGSVVIQALGPEPACEIQVRLTPLSGTTSMVVMFGAGCPFE